MLMKSFLRLKEENHMKIQCLEFIDVLLKMMHSQVAKRTSRMSEKGNQYFFHAELHLKIKRTKPIALKMQSAFALDNSKLNESPLLINSSPLSAHR